MWKRKKLKSIARRTLKANFWSLVAVCFIMAFFAGTHETSMMGIYLYDDANTLRAPVIQDKTQYDLDYSLAKVLPSILFHGADSEKLDTVEKITSAGIDSFTDDSSSLYKFFYGYIKLFIDHDYYAGIVFLISGLFGIFFFFFIRNPMVVGECRVFMETRTYTKTKFHRLFFRFRRGNFLNTVRVMFFMYLFLFLWTLTIVGVIIKYYSYRMVPCILAENPDVSYRDAMDLSKKMMDGNKWQTFLLDMSFIGWFLLSFVTFGVVAIFYSNPYITAVNTELYMTLRRNWIEQQRDHHELLNDVLLENPPANIV